MPDRVLREGILTSDMMNQLSWTAEVFYRRLMSKADDFGRYDARPSILRSSLFALRLDKVSDADVVKWLGECSKAGLVSVYCVDGKQYVEIQNFRQRLRAMKSKFPAPDGQVADIRGQMTANDGHMSPESDIESESDSETETETKKRVSPNGVGKADALPDDPLVEFKKIVKTKESVVAFIRKNNPQFIEPYVEIWNIFATETGLPQIQKINDSRKRKFKVRIHEKGFDFLKILSQAKKSEFLRTGKWFGFDWIFENETNYLKILEGNFIKPEDDHPEPAKGAAPKTFTETLGYLYGRYQEGALDPQLVLPEYYDRMVSHGMLPVGAMEPHAGSIEDKKRAAVIQAFNQKKNHGQLQKV